MFLSTPPSRVATLEALKELHYWHSVSIHATLAGGDIIFAVVMRKCGNVSIHATLAGGDAYTNCVGFLCCVSIHATLAGGDSKSVQKCTVSFAQKGKNYL